MFSKKNIHATIASLIHDLTVTSTPKIRLLKRTRPGVSALIAMIMVLAFMFTMSSVMIAMTRSLKIAQGGAAADQAYLNAVTGLELGLYQQNKPSTFVALVKGITGSSSYEVGQPITVSDNKDPNSQKQNIISFKVTDTLSNGGKVCGDDSTDATTCKTNSKMYYSYPFPGSGTMGGNNCNAATQPIVRDEQWYRDMYFFITGKQYAGTAQLSEMQTNNGSNPNNPNSTSTKTPKDQWDEFTTVAYINSSKFTTLDHPCLWNKLEPGVSAEIPLYNGFIPSPKDITEFWLRVKMPCNSGTVCRDSDERMIVAVPKSEEANRAILWDIVADCSKSPIDQVACFIKETIGKNAPDPIQQSVIQKQFLNNGNEISGAYNSSPFKNIVLSFAIKENGTTPLYGQTSAPVKPDLYTPILSFIKQLGVWKDMINPTMHLSIASSLPLSGSINKGEIPYIQYQILYKTSLEGAADKAIITNPTVTSTGQNGGYTINLESSLTKQTGTYGYALIGK